MEPAHHEEKATGRAGRASAGGATPIRVLIVEDHAGLAETLRMAIGFEPDMECVGLAPTASRALELAVECAPDVVLMDVRLPNGGGIEATARLKGLRPEASVIVLTAHPDPVYLLRAAEAGASGFLSKESRISEILKAVRLVTVGEPALRPHALQALMAEVAREERPAPLGASPELTSAERDLLGLVGEGLGFETIAAKLGITRSAARDRVEAVLTKLGARSQLEAVVLAVRARLLPGPFR